MFVLPLADDDLTLKFRDILLWIIRNTMKAAFIPMICNIFMAIPMIIFFAIPTHRYIVLTVALVYYPVSLLVVDIYYSNKASNHFDMDVMDDYFTSLYEALSMLVYWIGVPVYVIAYTPLMIYVGGIDAVGDWKLRMAIAIVVPMVLACALVGACWCWFKHYIPWSLYKAAIKVGKLPLRFKTSCANLCVGSEI